MHRISKLITCHSNNYRNFVNYLNYVTHWFTNTRTTKVIENLAHHHRNRIESTLYPSHATLNSSIRAGTYRELTWARSFHWFHVWSLLFFLFFFQFWSSAAGCCYVIIYWMWQYEKSSWKMSGKSVNLTGSARKQKRNEEKNSREFNWDTSETLYLYDWHSWILST